MPKRRQPPQPDSGDRILNLRAVQELMPVSAQSLRRWEALGLWPKRVKVGVRSIGWPESEVQKAIAERIRDAHR